MTLLREAETDPPRFLPATLPARRDEPPSVNCPRTDHRAWKTWRDAGEAMRGAPVVSFGQAWRTEIEPGLEPAAVALAHFGGELVVYAELSDADIFNPVRECGAHAYAHGDVFEIFLRAEGAENYFEHHLTPDNITLQLSFPTATAFGESCSSDPAWSLPFATAIPVPSQVLVQPALKLWRLLVVVPLKRIAPHAPMLPESWRFSFCRYDHTHGREKPVLSSSTPYRVPNFHQQERWGRLHLDDLR
jgi:hypothetical protein